MGSIQLEHSPYTSKWFHSSNHAKMCFVEYVTIEVLEGRKLDHDLDSSNDVKD